MAVFNYFMFSVAIFRMNDASINVTEGINASFPICVMLESLSGNLSKSITVSLTTYGNGTAIGELFIVGS